MPVRSVLKWIALLILLVGGYHYWYKVRPRMAVLDVLGRYETACYACDLHAVDKLMYHRIHDKASQKAALAMFDLFEKFEPGFDLLSAKRVDWDWGDEMIEVELTKVAKIDNEKRYFSNIMVINDGGGWKVFQYDIPDLTDF